MCVCARAIPTSGDEADGREQPCLRVVHLDGQELIREGEHQVCERPEPGVVHLRPVQCQSIGEGHGVLIRRVPCADTQDLCPHTHIRNRRLGHSYLFGS